MGTITLFHLGATGAAWPSSVGDTPTASHRWWDDLGTPHLDPDAIDCLVTGFGPTTPEQFRRLVAHRDDVLTAVLAATHPATPPGGNS